MIYVNNIENLYKLLGGKIKGLILKFREGFEYLFIEDWVVS